MQIPISLRANWFSVRVGSLRTTSTPTISAAPEFDRESISASSASLRFISGPRVVSGSAAFDWGADAVAPLGPGTIVVSHLGIPEQIGQDEPGVARALTDATVSY